MPSKVSSLVKGAVNNLISGSIGGLANSFIGAAGRAQTEKVAARLLNKSPLEIGNANLPPQTGHMAENPYQYGQVYYPETTSQLGEGHYMIFDIVIVNPEKFKSTLKELSAGENKTVGELTNKNFKDKLSTFNKTKLKGTVNNNVKSAKAITGLNSQDRLRNQVGGLNSRNPTHTHISDSIILYTPPQGLQTEYSVNYDMVETGLAGFLAEKGLTSIVEGLSTATGEIIRGLTDTISSALGGGGLRAVLDKSKARAKNPKKEQVFKDVNFRNFTYKFEFAPRNRKELDSAYKIIELFKFHMHPEIAPNRYFIVPSEFQITYMYREGANLWFPKVSRCVLKDMKVNYAPDNVVSTFTPDERGAAPVIFDMELSFIETEIMTKQTIALGF